MSSSELSATPPADLDELREVSARIGADPMLVQWAGGNTSVKAGNVMWIKASGTRLSEARDRDIFVAVDLPRMQQCTLAGDPAADQPQHFLLASGNTLRPSIETSLHALFAQRVVLHVHCIHTLAHAVQSDGVEHLREKLAGMNWVSVPYTRPGAELARTVSQAMSEQTRVVVLANHGLLVAGDSVADADACLQAVHRRLAVDAAPSRSPDLAHLTALADGSAYTLPDYPPLHQLALDRRRLLQASRGSLYPDHVIFCGVAVPVLQSGAPLTDPDRQGPSAGATEPLWLLVPDAGVLVHRDASAGALALMRCLADVLIRVPTDASLNYLSDAQNAELLDWDAEKYRRSLNG